MKLITMEHLHGFHARGAKHKHVMKDMVIGLCPSTKSHFLIPNFKGLKLMANTILLALIIATLPLGSAIRVLPKIKTELPLLFHELSNEGHLKSGDRVLVIIRDNDINAYDSRVFANNDEIAFVSSTDMKRQISLPNEHFDFVFTHDLSSDINLIDRTLKVNGIVTYEYNLKRNLAKVITPSSYKAVYLRRFDSTAVITLQKLKANTKFPTTRRLLGLTTTNGKKEILEKLEDVLLEPPRATRSKRYLKRTKFLPDLLDDSLESYPRRIFIDVGTPKKSRPTGVLGWFTKHYPKKNNLFEIYSIDTVAGGFSSNDVPQVGMSEWLRRNVKEEEYVVMKAEAEVAEDMVRNGVLGLVDELFLECKHQGLKGNNKKNRRAYWECLALYGRLRDEGVAVHQWWS